MSLIALEMNILVGLIGLLAGAGVTLLFAILWRLYERVQELQERIQALEAGGRKRMPYQAMDELLDAMAALTRLRDERSLDLDFLDNGLAHIQKAIQTGTRAGTNPAPTVQRDEGEL